MCLNINMLNVLTDQQRVPAMPFLWGRMWCRTFLLYKPKAASTGGGNWGNRCCWCTALSARRQPDKNDQSFQGDMVGMPPAARKDNWNRVVISSPWFMFAFSLRDRAWDCSCCWADDVAVEDWRLAGSWGVRSKSTLPLQERPLDVCRYGVHYGSYEACWEGKKRSPWDCFQSVVHLFAKKYSVSHKSQGSTCLDCASGTLNKQTPNHEIRKK